MTSPKVYFHRVGKRRQRGYSVWGAILGTVAALWSLGAVVAVLAR